MSKPDEVLLLPSGAQWLKADLHVHTPASSDMAKEWDRATAVDLVKIALEKELDVIAITDHNTAEWCDCVRRAAEGTSLTVFPGVEISTHQGHVLAIFDTNVCASRIEDLLVLAGINRDEFGSLDAATEKGIADVSTCIAQAGGVAIAAHADGNRGFLKMIDAGAERKRAFLAQDLWALELLDSSSRDGYQSGSSYGRRLACLQFSDCYTKGADHHQLDAMGDRYSFLKMDERSLSGLKLAMIDPDIRIRLSHDKTQVPEQVILGMWVTGGFLDGQEIRFNDNVSCLIGDTGSGKSVATELIRFGLDQQTGVKKIMEEVESLLKQQLGDLGTVHILLAKGGTAYLVERNRGKSIEKPLVQRVSKSGLDDIGDVDMRAFFPIKCFSQSEIIEFSRQPEVRLSLTDDLIDCSKELASIEGLKANLKKNAGEISIEQGKENNIRERLRERSGLIEALQGIDKILNHKRIAEQRKWYREEKLVKKANVQIEKLTGKSAELSASLALPSLWPEDLNSLPNKDLLTKMQDSCQSWEDWVAGLQDDAIAKLQKLEETFEALEDQWQARFKKSESDYRMLLERLDKDSVGLKALSERRKSTQDSISALEEIMNELNCEIQPRIKELNEQREVLLNKLQDNRKAITEKRADKAQELSTKLNNQVRLKVHARANIAGYERALQELVQGSYLSGAELQTLVTKCHPVALVKKLIAGDFDGLAKKTCLKTSKFERIWDTIVERNRIAGIYDLQMTDVEDEIEVLFDVGQGSYRRLEDLSHGQKCMVVLMVALAEGDFPLLVDQPEDALHAPSIEEGIVSALRSGRGTRQCIFATRNANILVSADAEQIIALKADANNGHVDATGSLDRFEHRQLIIYHVEGGEDAFQRRKNMYALKPS